MVEMAWVRAVDLPRCAAAFQPALPVRESRTAFWDNNRRLVARMSVSQALPILARARSDPAAHATLAFWGRTAVVALQLVTRGSARSEADDETDSAKQLGPLNHEDEARIRTAAATMPTTFPGEAGSPPGTPPGDPEADVLAFQDAVADGMTGSPVGTRVAGGATRPNRIEDHLSRTARAFVPVVGI